MRPSEKIKEKIRELLDGGISDTGNTVADANDEAYLFLKEQVLAYVLGKEVMSITTIFDDFSRGHKYLKWALHDLEASGDIHRDFDGDYSCAHPEIFPLLDDPHWGRCTACGDETFPITSEAAEMDEDLLGDRVRILRKTMEAIAKAKTLGEAKQRAKKALEETDASIG